MALYVWIWRKLYKVKLMGAYIAVCVLCFVPGCLTGVDTRGGGLVCQQTGETGRQRTGTLSGT